MSSPVSTTCKVKEKIFDSPVVVEEKDLSIAVDLLKIATFVMCDRDWDELRTVRIVDFLEIILEKLERLEEHCVFCSEYQSL
jgi:hypothetical protein